MTPCLVLRHLNVNHHDSLSSFFFLLLLIFLFLLFISYHCSHTDDLQGATSSTAAAVSAAVAKYGSASVKEDNSCAVCAKSVYIVEKIEIGGLKMHKGFV
jgi:hypothetical protein